MASFEGGIRIIFSRIAKKADDVIKDIIRKEKKYFIVISSDREVADFAIKHGSVPVSSDDFLKKIEIALRKSSIERGEGMPDIITEKMLLDEEEGVTRRRGSPRMPSKREKAIMRVLNKL